MNETQLLTRLADTDVFADEHPLPAGWSADEFLADLELKIDGGVTLAAPTHRRGLLLAAAAFAVVLIVGIGVALLAAQSAPEAPVVTDPPEEAVPPVDSVLEEGQAFVNALVADLNAGRDAADIVTSFFPPEWSTQGVGSRDRRPWPRR